MNYRISQQVFYAAYYCHVQLKQRPVDHGCCEVVHRIIEEQFDQRYRADLDNAFGAPYVQGFLDGFDGLVLQSGERYTQGLDDGRAVACLGVVREQVASVVWDVVALIGTVLVRQLANWDGETHSFVTAAATRFNLDAYQVAVDLERLDFKRESDNPTGNVIRAIDDLCLTTRVSRDEIIDRLTEIKQHVEQRLDEYSRYR